MDINDAINTVETFLEQYKSDNDDWNPTEIRILPSGDERDAIKVTINFGPDAEESEIDGLKDRAIGALAAAHSEISDAFRLEARALAD